MPAVRSVSPALLLCPRPPDPPLLNALQAVLSAVFLAAANYLLSSTRGGSSSSASGSASSSGGKPPLDDLLQRHDSAQVLVVSAGARGARAQGGTCAGCMCAPARPPA